MFVKKKHIQVIVVSSVIVSAVFISTIIGYSVYAQWKEDRVTAAYRNSIYALTGELFGEEIDLSNVNARIGVDELFPGMPLLEGSIKNNSQKIVTSIRIKVSFVEDDSTVVYNNWIYPLGEKHFGKPVLPYGGNATKNILMPGEGMSFRHLLRNCPGEVVTQLSTKAKFARGYSGNRLKLICEINGLSVL